MSGEVVLVDEQDVADLATFLGRARRVEATAVRLQATGSVLAVTVCPLPGHGLMGEGTVLGLRAFTLAQSATCDVVGAVEAVQDRLARMRTTRDLRLSMPPVPVVEAWAGLSAPRSGWERVGVLTADVVDEVTRRGVAAASAPGANREQVWGVPIPGTSLPGGAAFALDALGFSAPELTVFAQGRWHRISGPAGHVLTR
ncbi:MAG: hypothetical protein Q4G43_14825 [Mobilicoccus sp.]|nr:hypothetical protein [Mobilicoccus sp.]